MSVLTQSDTNQRRTIPGDDARGRHADSAVGIPKSGWKDIALRLKDRFGEDHVSLAAAGVAFFGFVAMVPLMAAGVSIYGLLADPDNVTSLVDRIDGSVPQEVAALIKQQLESVTESSSSALGIGVVIGIVLSLWSASSAFTNLIEAVNIAYNEDPDNRPFQVKRGLALGLTVGFLVLLGAVGVILAVASSLSSGGSVGWLWQIVAWTAIAVLMSFGIAVLYRYAPDRSDARWQWVSYGAALALIGWLAVSVGFRFYASRFGSYNETYGSLAAIVIMLFWLYLSAIVIIGGAMINAEIEHQTAEDTTVDPERPMGERDAYVADTIGKTRT